MSEDGPVGPASEAQRDLARRNMRFGCRWSKEKEAIFFAELAETANVTHACQQAGVTPSAAYQRRQSRKDFAAQWMAALEAGYMRLEMVLLDQSVNGVERVETVTDEHGGVKQVKTVRSFPHAVAMRLFQCHGETVQRYRAGQVEPKDDAQIAERIRTELARVRDRLAGRGGV